MPYCPSNNKTTSASLVMSDPRWSRRSMREMLGRRLQISLVSADLGGEGEHNVIP
jgi:hypothetical protein